MRKAVGGVSAGELPCAMPGNPLCCCAVGVTAAYAGRDACGGWAEGDVSAGRLLTSTSGEVAGGAAPAWR